MFMPVDLHWHTKQIYSLPVLELSARIKCAIKLPQQVYLHIALLMIEKVEKYGGIVVEPVGDIPTDNNIFFTVRFKSDKELRNFKENIEEKGIG